MTKTICLKAHAKINLFLEILGKRDDGYHDVDLVMQTISLCDEVEVTKDDSISISCDDKSLENDDNLCIRAAKLFFEHFGINGGCQIVLKKHIPDGAGLGGGSSDAATVFKALNTLFEVNVDFTELELLSAKLGSDIPFLIRGKTCRAVGRGTELIRLPDMPKMKCLIVKGSTKTPTKAAYEATDSLPADEKKSSDGIISAIENGDKEEICKNVFNRFNALYSDDGRFELLKNSRARCFQITGSGSAIFAIFDSDEEMSKTACNLKKNGYTIFECETE